MVFENAPRKWKKALTCDVWLHAINTGGGCRPSCWGYFLFRALIFSKHLPIALGHLFQFVNVCRPIRNLLVFFESEKCDVFVVASGTGGCFVCVGV